MDLLDTLFAQCGAKGFFGFENGGFDRAQRNLHRRADLSIRKLFQQVERDDFPLPLRKCSNRIDDRSGIFIKDHGAIGRRKLLRLAQGVFVWNNPGLPAVCRLGCSRKNSVSPSKER